MLLFIRKRYKIYVDQRDAIVGELDRLFPHVKIKADGDLRDITSNLEKLLKV